MRNRKGFTLVEIMIVVVIIGLLAAMAIPAFNKIRKSSIEGTMDNDARQIASASQQFFTKYPDATEVPTNVLVNDATDMSVNVTVADDETITVTEAFMKTLSNGVSIVYPDGTIELDETFALSHKQIDGDNDDNTRTYTSEGKR